MEKGKHIKLRIVFMGTTEFAKEILEKLLNNDYNVVAAYTKPGSVVGRKKETVESEVKLFAKEKMIEVYQPQKFTEEEIDILKGLKPDLIIVAAYGKILPRKILDIPGFGCINIHPSLLPKFRGPSPIQNTLLLGENITGTTIMLMDEGMDTGDIISQSSIEIDPNDNSETLSKKLSSLSQDLLLSTLGPWLERKVEPVGQDDSKATLCQLIERDDGRIIWEQDAQEIYNRYRAFYPWPGIFTFWKNAGSSLRLKLLKISLLKNSPQTKRNVGEVFEIGESVGVQTINGVIILEEIQIEGKNRSKITDFTNGYPDFVGSVLF